MSVLYQIDNIVWFGIIWCLLPLPLLLTGDLLGLSPPLILMTRHLAVALPHYLWLPPLCCASGSLHCYHCLPGLHGWRHGMIRSLSCDSWTLRFVASCKCVTKADKTSFSLRSSCAGSDFDISAGVYGARKAALTGAEWDTLRVAYADMIHHHTTLQSMILANLSQQGFKKRNAPAIREWLLRRFQWYPTTPSKSASISCSLGHFQYYPNPR